MQLIKDLAGLSNIENNQIIYDNSLKFTNSTIEIRGENNIIFFDKNVHLRDSYIKLLGDNSVVFIGGSDRFIRIRVDVSHGAVFAIGRQCSFNSFAQFSCAEGNNIFIGNDCMFSTNIFFRNSDAHPIYDLTTKKRINQGGDIIVGDHVWFGERVLVNKDVKIGSGAIVSRGALVAKDIPVNSINIGVPAKCAKTGVQWERTALVGKSKEEVQEVECASECFEYTLDSFDQYIDSVQKIASLDDPKVKFNELKILYKI